MWEWVTVKRWEVYWFKGPYAVKLSWRNWTGEKGGVIKGGKPDTEMGRVFWKRQGRAHVHFPDQW